jgi:hypothetical protein
LIDTLIITPGGIHFIDENHLRDRNRVAAASAPQKENNMKVRPVLQPVSLVVRVLLLCFVLLSSTQASRAQGLVSWWPGNGNFKDVVSGNNGIPIDGVWFLRAVYGEGFFFDGVSSRIYVPDVPSLAITGSMTISAWVWVACYPFSPNIAGQILIRGDDRVGLDPYSLCITPAGNLQFLVQNANNASGAISAPISLGTFVFVAATLDNATGLMSLYENGKLVAQAVTPVRPFANLDPNANPGIGIGNTQSANYNEYLEGIINDLKIYNTDKPKIIPAKLTLSPSTVKGGSTVSTLITLNDSSIVPVTASVSSTLAAVTGPAKVTIYAGLYSMGFALKTKAVTTTETGKVSVVVNGVTLSANLTITP